MAKRILYHGTSMKNLPGIMEEGLKSQFEGVYLTDSAESAAKWVGFRLHAMGEREVLVVEVEVDEDSCEEGVDHSPMMVELFGVGESVLHPDRIPSGNIKNYLKFELGGPVTTE